MKRSPELRDLSEEHHYGLVAARSLRLAADGKPEELPRATAAFLETWEREVLPHFESEEAVLLPALAAAAGDDHPLIARTLAEHEALRRGARELAEAGGAERAAEVAAALHDHIRFEERLLFPEIERALAGLRLAELGRRLREWEKPVHACSDPPPGSRPGA